MVYFAYILFQSFYCSYNPLFSLFLSLFFLILTCSKRGTYRWLILTGKVKENGKVKTKLIKNFYGKGKEEKLKRLVKLYRAIKVLSDNK